MIDRARGRRFVIPSWIQEVKYCHVDKTIPELKRR